MSNTRNADKLTPEARATLLKMAQLLAEHEAERIAKDFSARGKAEV